MPEWPITCPGHTAYSVTSYALGKWICASTVEASEPVFRHISRVCGTASSVRIEVFRTASSVCKVVNKVDWYSTYLYVYVYILDAYSARKDVNT